MPRGAWLCAVVATLTAICWSIVSPPFQAPDEPDHYAYVKQLAETGSLPVGHGGQFAKEEILALSDLRFSWVRQEPQARTIRTRMEQVKLGHDLALASQTGERGSAEAGVATSQPPLYYALESVPYTLAGGTVLDRLAAMRLLSALFAGLTAFLVFLFVREVVPREPWAWLIGGLASALVPVFAFASATVNPDALLFAVSAAAFYFLARAFKRGLSRTLTVAIGCSMAVGLLTKLNFLGLVPGITLGLILLARRVARESSRGTAARRLGAAVAIGYSPAIAYAVVNLMSGHAVLGNLSDRLERLRQPLAELNYIWQLYLPRIPGTHTDFPGIFTAKRLWFDGYVGLYGWLDTTFPPWVYKLAVVPGLAVTGLLVAAIVTNHRALHVRAGEVTTYLAVAVGVLVMIGAASYAAFPEVDAEYVEVRYLLPLLPLFAVSIALAARGAGRRWGPAVGALIVVMFLAHNVFSQLLVAQRFYG